MSVFQEYFDSILSLQLPKTTTTKPQQQNLNNKTCHLFCGRQHIVRRATTFLSRSEMSTANIPIIDMGPFRNGSPEERREIARKIREACEDIGFMVITNTGVDQTVIDDAWNVTTEFFDMPDDVKKPLEMNQDEYPFGYTSIGGEILHAGKASENQTESENLPDLKEMFSIGPEDPAAGMPPRIWPDTPETFAAKWAAYYDALGELAQVILHAFAISLDLPENYFEQFTDHHASAMRALNYPHIEGHVPLPGQLRASAHTDYGVITILRSGGMILENQSHC